MRLRRMRRWEVVRMMIARAGVTWRIRAAQSTVDDRSWSLEVHASPTSSRQHMVRSYPDHGQVCHWLCRSFLHKSLVRPSQYTTLIYTRVHITSSFSLYFSALSSNKHSFFECGDLGHTSWTTKIVRARHGAEGYTLTCRR